MNNLEDLAVNNVSTLQTQPEEEILEDVSHLTLRSEEVRVAIKMAMRAAWARKLNNEYFTQANLSRALKVTQSGMSKILNNDDGNAWNTLYLRDYAAFTNQSLVEILPRRYSRLYQPLLDEFKRNDPAFREECRAAVQRYFRERNRSITPENITKLAEELFNAYRDNYRNPPPAELTEKLETIILGRFAK